MVLFTLEIRSAEGELWYLRARAAEHIQYMLSNKILPAEGFADGGYKIIIRPYNKATDEEDIGDLAFLDKKVESPYKIGDGVWCADLVLRTIEVGEIHDVFYKNGELETFTVRFDYDGYATFAGDAMEVCVFSSEDAARRAVSAGGQ